MPNNEHPQQHKYKITCKKCDSYKETTQFSAYICEKCGAKYKNNRYDFIITRISQEEKYIKLIDKSNTEFEKVLKVTKSMCLFGREGTIESEYLNERGYDKISRKQCKFTFDDGDGCWSVERIKESQSFLIKNGTRADTVEIRDTIPHVLSNKTILTIGTKVFEVIIDE